MIFSDMSFQPPAADQPMFQDEPYHHHHHDQPNSISLHSLSSCPLPLDFQGVSPMLMGRSMSFSGMDQRCEELVRGEDEMSDDGSQLLGEKKRRLNLEQVKALEKSFELGNKLEPDRKMQLARALGLQPRQIAIWFQTFLHQDLDFCSYNHQKSTTPFWKYHLTT